MAEALATLGVAASVIAVIQISEQVVSACYQYYKTTKDAKKEIIDVINVVSGLKSTLENLRHLLDDNDQDSRLSHQMSLVGALKACEEALEQLASKLGIKIVGDLNTDSIKINFKKKMMWPCVEYLCNFVALWLSGVMDLGYCGFILYCSYLYKGVLSPSIQELNQSCQSYYASLFNRAVSSGFFTMLFDDLNYFLQ